MFLLILSYAQRTVFMGQHDVQRPANLDPFQRLLYQLADGVGLVRPLIPNQSGAVDPIFVNHKIPGLVLKNAEALGAGIVLPKVQTNLTGRKTVFFQQLLKLFYGFGHLEAVFRGGLNGDVRRAA